MSQKDWDYVAALEKAVKEKYGDNGINDPRVNWNEEKEQEYRQQIIERAELLKEKHKNEESVEKNGFLIKKKLVNKDYSRECPINCCKKYSFNIKDDVYMNKFGCCYECYVKFVEGREHLWEQRRKDLTNGSD